MVQDHQLPGTEPFKPKNSGTKFSPTLTSKTVILGYNDTVYDGSGTKYYHDDDDWQTALSIEEKNP